MLKKLILIAIICVFSTCKESKSEDVISRTDKLEYEETPKRIIPKNVDSKFIDFLRYFSKDSVFQITRIDFPIKVKQLDIYELELSDKDILISDYWINTFLPYDPNNLDYTQDIVIEDKKAFISINGKENGLAIEYEFQKINGKWKLITWIDYST